MLYPLTLTLTHFPHSPVTLVGTQNLNGTSVFDCVPAEGEIPAGGFREITVKFEPDHASDHFSDVATIQLFGQQVVTRGCRRVGADALVQTLADVWVLVRALFGTRIHERVRLYCSLAGVYVCFTFP